jgi:hypothetical protein
MPQDTASLNIVIGNDDPALFAIAKKWIAYAQESGDNNDIAAAIWSAVAEASKVSKEAQASLPMFRQVAAVTRHGKRADGHPWHGLNIREDGSEDLAAGSALYVPLISASTTKASS